MSIDWLMPELILYSLLGLKNLSHCNEVARTFP